jgi:Tfp pilus assembly protein PilZ
MEKRDSKRLSVRLVAKYGVDQLPFVGFTEDISYTGIHLKTNVTLPPKTELMVNLTLPDGRIAHLTGKVMWAKRIPPAGARSEINGMGIRVLKADQAYLDFIKTNLA